MYSLSGSADLQSGALSTSDTGNPAYGKLRDTTLRESMRMYLYVVLTAACMVVAMFVICRIYPFGDATVCYLDDGTQNFAILASFQRALLGEENLLYSWSTVLGGNMAAMYAYGAASPFNLLAVFFPENLMAAYHLIFAVKFIAAALCFAVMLKGMFPEAAARFMILFSVSYPFIGYMTYFAWNQSWMDGVVFLPLVSLGIWKLAKRQSPILYITSLAVVLISSFYVGYMICVASVLFYGCAIAFFWSHMNRSAILRSTLSYAVSTAAALGVAAFVLIPAYKAMPDGLVLSAEDLLNDIAYTSRPEETLSMLYTAPFENMQYSDNYPVIYAGIVQFVLVITFFLNKSVSSRYKTIAAVLLVIIILSFTVSIADAAWHGFASKVWFNFRYSFIASFVIEVIAFYSFVNISGTRKQLMLSGLLAGIVTMIAMETAKSNIGSLTLLFDVVWICATITLLYLYEDSIDRGLVKKQNMCFLLIAGLTLSNLIENASLSLDSLSDLNDYETAQTIDEEIVGCLETDGFYRTGSTWRYGEADPMRLGYAGVENFNNYENYSVVDAVSRLGLSSTSERKAHYDRNVPIATDTLLGVRYIVTDTGSYKEKYYSTLANLAESDLDVLENPFVLPIVFPVESPLEETDTGTNRIEHINEYWNSVSEAGGDIFIPLLYTLTKTETDDGTDLTIQFTADTDGPVYAYIPRGKATFDAPFPSESNEIFCLDDFEAGENGELVLHTKDSYKGTDRIALYSEKTDVIELKSEAAQTDPIEIEDVSNTHLVVNYASGRDSILASTIPFDEGWSVYIDGIEADPFINMDTFLAFDVPAGQHEIELKYWPPYLTFGISLSVLSITGVVLFAILQRRKERRID